MKLFRLILLLAVLAVFATACTKEDAVQPCGNSEHQAVNAKNRTGGTIGLNGEGTNPQEGISGGGPAGEPGTGQVGISDDGDDISDSEKTRKKRRTTTSN